MAETTTTTPKNTPRSKPASAKVAKKRTAARRARTTAQRQTRSAAQANATAARATARQGRSLAERAALVYVGATLEARDRVVGTVETLADNYGSRKAAERRLKQLEARFERRGTTARNRFEREVRARRQRVERDLRGVSRDAGAQAGLVGSQVENLVQTGVTAGTQAAARLTERVARVV